MYDSIKKNSIFFSLFITAICGKYICGPFSALCTSSSERKNKMKLKGKARRLCRLARVIPYFCHWSSFMPAFSSSCSSFADVRANTSSLITFIALWLNSRNHSRSRIYNYKDLIYGHSMIILTSGECICIIIFVASHISLCGE